jgi:hypothetical protein
MVPLPWKAELGSADTDLGDVLCPPGVTGRPASTLRPLVPLADGDRSIDVAVTDESGAPIAGAAVSVRLAGMGKLDRGRIRTLGDQPLPDRAPEIRAVTDAKGRATVDRLFDAVWQVDVEAPGFGAASAPTDVPAPATVAAKLSPLHAFSGRVVLRSGEPVARAQVSFTAQRQGIPSSIVETSADGRFVFDDLPEGPISLVVEPTMFTPVSFLPATVHSSGVDMEGISLRVAPARTIEGVVLGRGHPLTPGVRVSAHWAQDQREPVGGHRSTYAWTDAAGRYVLRGLAPGRWRLEGGARPVTVESGATGVSLVSEEQRRW